MNDKCKLVMFYKRNIFSQTVNFEAWLKRSSNFNTNESIKIKVAVIRQKGLTKDLLFHFVVKSCLLLKNKKLYSLDKT